MRSRTRAPSAMEVSSLKTSSGMKRSTRRLASSWRRKPVAFFNPFMVCACSSGLPMTLTKTLAWRRSPLTSTWVMLAKPTRGSLTRVRNSSLSSTAINSPSFSCLCVCGMDLQFSIGQSWLCSQHSYHRKPAGYNWPYLCSWVDALLYEGLDDIADLKCGEVFEHHTALVAPGDLAQIVLSTTQRGDCTLVDLLVFAS